MTLKQKTISGLFWSSIESVSGQGITFITGIILARILSPAEFGLIGMLTIFITISQSFIDSGFRLALLRKNNCSNIDYSTVFYTNIITGIIFYILLFFFSSLISKFFKQPLLESLTKVIGLGLIINSVAIIQGTILMKQLDFKLQTKISIIASTISGIVSISMAYNGYGVWSLVALTLIKYSLNSILLWTWSKWYPLWCFSKKSFMELFSFGSKLLISSLLDIIYNNINIIIIGKYISVTQVGYYSRAEQFQSLPSSNLQGIIGRVTFPLLSKIQDDIPQMRETFRKIIKSTMFVTSILMIGLAAIAKPLILLLIGEKWEQSIIYLQMLCFVGLFYPLHTLNLDILKILGKSNLYLRLEFFKKILGIPIFLIIIFWGIQPMIIGLIMMSIIYYYINSYWSGRLIGYTFTDQLKDILPSLLLALIVGSFVLAEALFFSVSPLYLLSIQLISGAFLTFVFCEVFHFKDYLYIKEIVKGKIAGQKSRKEKKIK